MVYRKFKHIIKNYLIGWLIAGIVFEFLRKTDLKSNETQLSVQFIFFLFSWLLEGVLFGTLHFIVVQFFRKKIAYGKLLVLTLFLQTLVGFFVVILMFPLIKVMGFQNSLIDVLLLTSIHISLVYAFFVNFIISIMLEVNLILGKGILKSIIRGKFYKPYQDSRVFMFLDLKSSTTHAEKLGHIKYSRLIQDCFYDLAVVDNYKAEVYKYVGDEVILVWNVEDGLQNLNCIKAFFSFDDELKRRKDYYSKEYGIVPEFKAGLYKGEVTIAEVGELKREIAYLGDTVNTTARIEGECNRFNAKLLLSECLLKELSLENAYKTEFKGNIILRGKEDGINLFSVKKVLTEEES